MKLISSPLSPFVRKVRVLLLESGLDDQVEVVDVTTTPLETDPQAAAANPLGKIPALVRLDGPAIHDSRVITRYLDARADGRFYPEARLWEVLTLEAIAEGIMEAALAMTYEARFRPEEIRYAPWVEGQWAKVARALEAVEGRWMSHLAGPLDMSHIALGCALGYLDFRHDARGWRVGHPALEAWYAKMAARDSMMRTAPA
ncbi:putative GST-like protein YibF [Roseovarius sp. EC-HK134]|uniref:Putative GST-like protein YibF n=1 Tax=Roseovarius mucosus TaxID=215743 RepID=A0A1V0RS26_9RHOB|nr:MULTISPECIES: glutathione S-transferase [Roseovarius]ARE84445.1 putative GST-like protein YibF [Roseovarius mucosus]AWZ20587.1 Glutathione S-transferase family protein [Roseovarius sp. AK1035]EDM31338.1 glutathione S-transferase family protein [Roseovarius sp. TM1035]VVT18592.1 putative GST-like protein YibF [Roseovarius sp. EC-SD190]VVT18707.1 putative GST-like protein YibF [Roseovarius sp. EC-HK134]